MFFDNGDALTPSGRILVIVYEHRLNILHQSKIEANLLQSVKIRHLFFICTISSRHFAYGTINIFYFHFKTKKIFGNGDGNMKIHFKEKPSLKNPTLIAAWPGMGMLARMSADYLIQQLDAK
jgi:hypothetical protein